MSGETSLHDVCRVNMVAVACEQWQAVVRGGFEFSEEGCDHRQVQ